MKYSHLISIIIFMIVVGCSSSTQDYLALHNQAMVVDLHSDTVLRMKKGFDFTREDSTGHLDLVRLKKGGVDLQVFACWLDTDTEPEECRPYVDMLLDSMEAQIQRNSDKIAICTDYKEAVEIINSGRIAAFLSIENGVAIASDIENLRHFYDRGVRYMTLTHTKSNNWCISSADTLPAFKGLTDLGRDIVKEMNSLGMIIDISHAHPEAVNEILKITSTPVIASHSCVYELCQHDRNLTDEQIKAIADNGGVIGINFFNAYLSQPYNDTFDSLYALKIDSIKSIKEIYKDNDSLQRAYIKPIKKEIMNTLNSLVTVDVNTVVDHIDHIVHLVGPDHVGLGSDFDGVPFMPKGLEDCSMIPNITKELINRNYNDVDIKKILGGNFMRVFKTVS